MSVLNNVVLTEKSSRAIKQGVYVFYADVNVNKIEIKKYFKQRYAVDVLSIRALNLKGKRCVRGRIVGQRPDRKKIYVTLKEGQVLDRFKDLF
jgi:large subunit ribosomal protein L23